MVFWMVVARNRGGVVSVAGRPREVSEAAGGMTPKAAPVVPERKCQEQQYHTSNTNKLALAKCLEQMLLRLQSISVL